MPVVTNASTPLASAPLVDALEQLRLDGAIFFRAEFTEPWAFESPLAQIAPVIRPGAQRHDPVPHRRRGTCWVAARRRRAHWAERGDVIVLPYGDDT